MTESHPQVQALRQKIAKLTTHIQRVLQNRNVQELQTGPSAEPGTEVSGNALQLAGSGSGEIDPADPRLGDRLVALWHMNNNAADSSGNGNNGDLVGGAVCNAPGMFGTTGCWLNGAGAYVRRANPKGTTPSDNLTLAAWVKTTSTDTWGAQVISMGDDYGIMVEPTGTVRFFKHLGNENWSEVTAKLSILDNQWHHIAAVQSATSGMALYIDGRQEAIDSSDTRPIVYTHGSELRVGRYGSDDGYQDRYDFNGTIDEVGIWARELASNEIRIIAAGSRVTISATAQQGGMITPSGSVQVRVGADQTFAIVPNKGYRVADVLVDGVSVGPVATYAFAQVNVNHTIDARFATQEPVACTANPTSLLVHVNTPEFIVLTGEDSQGRNSMTPLASPMTFTLVTQPQHGTFSGTTPTLTYLPAKDYQGPDSFTFTADDGTGPSASATIRLTVAPWTAPIGIPEPEFGIRETVDAIYGPGYYTYYIDNTNPNATNTNNPKGTATQPRLTIPDPLILTPGDVVLIAGGAYTQVNDNYLNILGGGTPDRPAFIRGISAANMPSFDRRIDLSAASDGYIILENLKLDGTQTGLGVIQVTSHAHHVAVRNCEFMGAETSPVQIYNNLTDGSKVDHIVVYNNLIHDNGDWLADYDQDYHGVCVWNNTSDIWVLDSEMFHNSGNGLQILLYTGTLTNQPQNIYVGRNTAHHNKQAGLWTKTATNVIFSQNVCYGGRPVGEFPSGQGDGMGIQYGPENVWVLFNEIYDCDNGIRLSADDGGTGQNLYIIGNVIHDIHHSTVDMTGQFPVAYDPNDPWSPGKGIAIWHSKAVKHIIGNTIYNADGGIYHVRQGPATIIANNIISGIDDGVSVTRHVYIEDPAVASASELYNNLFDGPARIAWGTSTVYDAAGFQAAFPGKGLGSVETRPTDPLFVGPATNDFHLQYDSGQMNAAVDAGASIDQYVSLFQSLYGLNIGVDFAGTRRPRGLAPDIGA